MHTAAGIPVSGVTVEVYVNETKEHGGTKIGTTVTRFGTFQASVEIPTEMELGSYQLLARAVANEDFYESWSDPDITVYSSSGLELTSPAEVPVDVEAVFHGKVLDDTGKGVADRQVNVTIDGRAGPPVTTSPTGTFSFSRTFSAPGGHWVAVEVKGQEYLLDNQVRLDFQVTLPTDLTLLAPALVSVNEAFTVNGELRDVRGEPLAGEYVSVSVGDDPEVRALTDGSGHSRSTAGRTAPGTGHLLGAGSNASFGGSDSPDGPPHGVAEPQRAEPNRTRAAARSSPAGLLPTRSRLSGTWSFR